MPASRREKRPTFQIFIAESNGWSKLLLAKIPEIDRAEVEDLIHQESDRLTAYLSVLRTDRRN